MILMLPEEILPFSQYPDRRGFPDRVKCSGVRIDNPDPGLGPFLNNFRQGQLAEFSETDDKYLIQNVRPLGNIPITEGNFTCPSGKKRREASGADSRPEWV